MKPEIIKRLEQEKYSWNYQSIEIPGYTFEGKSKDFETWNIIKDLVNFENKTVADISCFHGYFSINIAKMGGIVDGYDTSETILNYAREITKLNNVSVDYKIFNADYNTITKKYDIILNLSCLHYYKDKRKFLNNIKDKANEFIFEVNNADLPELNEVFSTFKNVTLVSKRHPERTFVYFYKFDILNEIAKRPHHHIYHIILGKKEYIMKTQKEGINIGDKCFLPEFIAYKIDRLLGINLVPNVKLLQLNGITSIQDFVKGEVPLDFYIHPDKYDSKGELALLDLIINNYNRNEHNIISLGRKIYATDNSEAFQIAPRKKSESFIFYKDIPITLIKKTFQKENEIYDVIKNISKFYNKEKEIVGSIEFIKDNIKILKDYYENIIA